MGVHETSTLRGSPGAGGRRTEGAIEPVGRTPRGRWPLGYDSVGEALSGARSPLAACADVGRSQALEGASLGEALSHLRTTYHAVGHREPDVEAVEALALAWSEGTLESLLDLTCEDPLTGLSGVAHLRSRLREVYEGGHHDEHAFLVVRLERDPTLPRLMRLALAGEALRAVLPGGETLTHAGGETVVALGRRGPGLPLVARAATDSMVDLGLLRPRIWVEGLPANYHRAADLLMDLPRG